jgi:endonuclease YncB( thermonuclease family)
MEDASLHSRDGLFVSQIKNQSNIMNSIKSFYKTYSKKWYFWVGVLFLVIIAIPNAETKVPIPQKQKLAESNNSQNLHPSTTTSPIKVEEKKIVTTAPQPTKTIVAVQQPTSQTEYSVVSVVDGDTVKVSINGTTETLRLIGLDTPETVDPRKTVQCFGKEASNKAKELLTGKKVRIEKDATQGDKDKYGRTLAYIYVGDIFYNKYMIEQGYAHEYTYNTPYKYQAEFKLAQKTAETNKAGLWSPSTCNGVTTSPAKVTTVTTSTEGNFYTSSYSTSKYYYPQTCDGWKSLNSKYLKTFSSLGQLLAQYPSRVKSPECQ